MLTKLIIHNFKKFGKVEIPLGDGFAFIGPNNSGKTSALQALALWHAGLQEWLIRSGNGNGRQHGITINRKNLVFLPTPHPNALWHNKKITSANRKRIRIDIIVHGATMTEDWQCGLEFDYSNEETFFCRPKREDEAGKKRMPIPRQAHDVNVILIPPMSGLAETEPLIQIGRIHVLLGQGRTAEVLRNICYLLAEEKESEWKELCSHVNNLFGVQMEKPQFDGGKGIVELYYKQGGIRFDIQNAGRGMHQVILLLAFLLHSPSGTVFLLDEPDAHLEILRQEKFYNLIQECAKGRGSQVFAASHSEKVLQEAASKKSVVAFVGEKPRMLDDGKTDEVIKSLNAIGWDKYYQAEMQKWVLFLEGENDKRILLAFARKLNHPAADVLMDCFVSYIGKDTLDIKLGEFSALKYAVPALGGLAITDKEQKGNRLPGGLEKMAWFKKREIENYIFSTDTLLKYAASLDEHPDESLPLTAHYEESMAKAIEEVETGYRMIGSPSLFSDDRKISDDISSVLKKFASLAKIKPLNKSEFHTLVAFIPDDQIHGDVKKALNKIVQSYNAVPR